MKLSCCSGIQTSDTEELPVLTRTVMIDDKTNESYAYPTPAPHESCSTALFDALAEEVATEVHNQPQLRLPAELARADVPAAQTQDGSTIQTQQHNEEHLNPHREEAVKALALHDTANEGDGAKTSSPQKKSVHTGSTSSSKNRNKARNSVSSSSSLKPGAVCYLRDVDPSFTATHETLGISLLLTKGPNGTVRCVENVCPHTMYTKLSTGDIEDINGQHCVVCPRHRKRFNGGFCVNLDTGVCMSHDGKPLAYEAVTFDCSVKNGQVFVGQPKGADLSRRRSPMSRKNVDASDMRTKPRTSLAERSGITSDDLWKVGTIKSKRWLTVNLIELQIDIPDLTIPTTGFWHYCLEYSGIEREYTPVPGSVKGLAVLWIRIYEKGEFSQVIRKARKGHEVRVQVEDTLADLSVQPVAVIAAGTGALVACHDLSLPHLGSFKSDKDFDLFENLGFKTARVTGELADPPVEPECCNQGCDPCVLDKYNEMCIEHEKHKKRRRGRIEEADLEHLPDGPVIVCGPDGFNKYIQEFMKNTNKKAIVLEG